MSRAQRRVLAAAGATTLAWVAILAVLVWGKLAGHIDASWAVVLAPLWAPIAAAGVFAIIINAALGGRDQ